LARQRTAIVLVFATLGFGIAHAGPFDPPDPRTFARAEDQKRARLLMTPCTEADVGRGCYRHQGRISREYPCSYHIDASTIGSLPTDQCYKMEEPRRHRGIWIDEFEGQAFVPEGTRPPSWPTDDSKAPGWKERAEEARLARIWIDTRRVDLDRASRRRGTRRFIEFVGRKTRFPGVHGHFGMFGSEIIVDRVIALRECPAAGICG
jgi:hypothetical protein